MAPTACLLALVALASCAARRLDHLMLDGGALHASLAHKSIDQANHGVPEGVRSNPCYATDAEVVASIASYASQGRLAGEGICAGLYAVYQDPNELGFYGLQTASADYADQLEGVLRGIWSHNVGLDRARIHRRGPVLLVVWHDGVSPQCWRAVNAGLVERLALR